MTTLPDVLRDQADAVDVGEAGLAALAAGARSRRRRTHLGRLGLAAAATLGLVGAAVLLASPGGSRTLRVGPAATVRPSEPEATGVSPPPPAGMQAVQYRGVQVFVPDTWVIGATRCGTPQQDTVVVPTTTQLLCAAVQPAGLTVVTFRRLDPNNPVAPPAGTPAASRVLTFPDREVAVVVTGDDPGVVAALAATVRVVDVDAYGCAVTLPSDGYRPSAPPAASLVPGEPVAATVCSYSSRQLVASAPVPAARLDDLLAALRGADPVGPATDDACAAVRTGAYLVRLAYADGSTRVLVAGGLACDGSSLSDGTRLAPLGEHLSRLLGDLALRRTA